MSFKDELVKLLIAGRDIELNFVAGLSPAARAEVGTLARWSAKDNIAHIAYWRERRVADYQRVIAGGEMTYIEDFNHLNDSVFGEYKDVPWDTVSAFSTQAYEALYDQVGRMSDEELQLLLSDGRPLWRLIANNGYLHPIVHLGDYHREHGAPAKKVELLMMMGQPLMDLDDSADWQGLVKYNLACALALDGQAPAAIAELKAAFMLNPQLLEWSKEDSDLTSLRAEPAYQALYDD